jgi:ABC-type phosphate/phosphonate transport system ATPase subunit
MNVTDLLKRLDLGSSVAEFDQMIDRHFVKTNVFQDLIEDKVDIVVGDKGAGKTTIYRYLQKQYTTIHSSQR